MSGMQLPVINFQLHPPGNIQEQKLQNIIAWMGSSKQCVHRIFQNVLHRHRSTDISLSRIPSALRLESPGKDLDKKKIRSAIGRITIVNSREGERYYERLVLNHVRGPISLKGFLTIEGRQYETFEEAAKEKGLLESDNSISECLGKVVLFKMPPTLRSLFATILVYCNPTDVRKLWDTYFEDIYLRTSAGYMATHPMLYYNVR